MNSRQSLLPTVTDFLALPQIARAIPKTLSSAKNLNNTVRGVRIGDVNLAEPLDLILTTGADWPSSNAELTGLAKQLSRIEVSGVILALGPRIAHAPESFIQTCAALGLPFTVLESSVDFASVVEEGNRLIISRQAQLLQLQSDSYANFLELIQQGADTGTVLAKIAEVLQAPVGLFAPTGVLIDLSGTPDALANEALTADKLSNGLRAPIRMAEQEWGFLATTSYLDETALKQGALALAILRARAGSADIWRSERDARIVAAVMDPTLIDWSELEVQLKLLGLGFVSDGATGLALDFTHVTPRPHPERMGQELRATGFPSALARPITGSTSHASGPQSAHVTTRYSALIPTMDKQELSEVMSTFRAQFPGVRVAVGKDASLLEQTGSSLRQAAQLLDSAQYSSLGLDQEAAVLRAHDHPLRLLAGTFATRPELRDFVNQVLGPLLSWDSQHDGDLLQVLAAYLRQPANRTAAANDSHLSRSVFYQRLAQIEELLDLDLNSGDAIATLYTALLAHQLLD